MSHPPAYLVNQNIPWQFNFCKTEPKFVTALLDICNFKRIMCCSQIFKYNKRQID